MNSFGILDHQVAVERQLGGLAQALHHRRPKRDVGHKMAVHHVHVDHRAAAPLGRGNLIRQMGKIRRKNRRQKLNHFVTGNSSTVEFFRRASCQASLSAEPGESLRLAI